MSITGPRERTRGPRLDARDVTVAPGPAWCRAWTARVDGVLTALASDLHAERGLAVVALGSYARQELCPGSDVDLLLLHAGWGRGDLTDLVQRLCYPLWDAGLQVGHAVRTPTEAVRAAADRVDTATALTDRRLVTGDRGLLDDLASRADRWLRRNAGSVLADVARSDRDRHARAGWRPGMLEPHLKDGSGGLRDLHRLRWAAACLLGEVGLDALVGARYLGAADRRELAAAGDTLLSARCALHLVRGAARRPPGSEVDRLRLDVQDETAARLGLADGDELLRRVGLATRTVAHVHGRTWPLLVEDAGGRRRLRAAVRSGGRDAASTGVGDGLVLRDGGVAVGEDRTLRAEPDLGLRALAAAGERGVGLERRTAERLRREVADAGSLVWDRGVREAFVGLLRSGSRGLPAFADADHLGVVEALLPEWARVRGRPQRNPFHRYDLDTHAVQTVVELVDLAGGAVSDAHAGLYEGLAHPDTLLVAAFLHDVGKAWEGDHSVVGARLAGTWVGRMGYGAETADRVARLVRHHLLLPDVATRRDLDDPAELHRVAAATGDVETLDGLYLLSLADARATGPTAHSPWKDGLLGELHRRVRRILDGGGAPLVPVAQEVAAAARASAGDDTAVARLVESVDERYLAAAGTAQVLAHAALLADAPAPGVLRADVRDGPAEGTVVISVVAADRLGLVADCAGVLAAHGLEVLDARAFTTEGGVALDWFVVRAREGAEGRGGPERRASWSRVRADLVAAGRGDLDVEAAVAARERQRDERPRALAAPVPVDVRLEAGQPLSRIEVHGPDGPGVLYRVARALSDTGVDIAGARVATLGPQVRDVFFVHGDAESFPPGLPRELHAAALPRDA